MTTTSTSLDETVRAHDPTRLVIYAAYRIAQRFDLPRHLNVRTLITSASETKTNVMVSWYTRVALEAVSEYPDARALVLGRRVAEAAVIAMALGQQVQRISGSVADNGAMLLLIMVLAAAYTRQDEELGDLFDWLAELATEIDAL